MRLLLAIFLPFVAFFTIGRPIAGIICLILQITLIGWLPAAIWAVYALGQYKTDKKIEKGTGWSQDLKHSVGPLGVRVPLHSVTALAARLPPPCHHRAAWLAARTAD